MVAKTIKRKEISYLKTWISQARRKPLIIRGARQVGKSTLVKVFAEQGGHDLLEINFERNPEYRKAFSSNDPGTIVQTLGLLMGRSVDPSTCLLFLDEIQVAPEALVALRYFYEEMPELAIVCAGSLLEFTLADAQFSMPVGRVEYLYLGPLQFEDFVVAMGQPLLVDYLTGINLKAIQQQALSDPVHQKLLAQLKQYFVVGGMPEAVVAFVETNDFIQVSRVQQSIVATYRDDFNKYGNIYGGDRVSGKRELVPLVFDKLPTLVGRKLKYADISRDHRSADLSQALNQLCLARVSQRIYHTSANGVPLSAEQNTRFFKMLFMDVGLMCAALKLSALDLKGDLTLVNNGAIAEQFIGQHLLHREPWFMGPELHYWAREKRGAAAEVDYVLSAGQQVFPVEVKAGTTGSLKSLQQFLAEKNSHFACRFNADTPSLLKARPTMTSQAALSFDLLSLPMYMVGQQQRLVAEYFAGNS